MRNRIRLIARQLYLLARSAELWPWLLASRLFPPPDAARARALERERRTEDALNVWQAHNTRASKAEMLRLRMKRLRQANAREDWTAAVGDLAEIRRILPGDRRITAMVANAALSGARKAQSEGRWLDACRMWLIFAGVTSDTEKARRNLIQSARLTAESAGSMPALLEAIEAWRLVEQFDLSIGEARRGIVWCQLTIAREAQRSGDLPTARQYWQAAIQTAPDDPRARDALRRLDGAVAQTA
jgi:tetratricopeptide (TPR) repeat protein